MDDTSVFSSATSDCWSYLLNKSGDELRQCLVCTSLELEYTRITAKEEMERNEHQLKQLLQLLNQTCKERDEANQRYQKVLMIMPYAHLHPTTTTTPPTTTSTGAAAPPLINYKRILSVESTATSDCDSISGARVSISSPAAVNSINMFDHFDTVAAAAAEDINDHHVNGGPLAPADQNINVISPVVQMKAFDNLWPAVETKLPEKGKLLQAVMNAGPLLQTLLLAGPLPQWRHPPPPLDSFQIPPVGVVGSSCCGTRVPAGTASTKKRPPESMESSSKYAA